MSANGESASLQENPTTVIGSLLLSPPTTTSAGRGRASSAIDRFRQVPRYRRFCSTRCRVSHWHQANAAPSAAGPLAAVPLHWHLGTGQLLTGDVRAGYLRGLAGYPPSCSGIAEPYKISQPVEVGREGLPPREAPPAKQDANVVPTDIDAASSRDDFGPPGAV